MASINMASIISKLNGYTSTHQSDLSAATREEALQIANEAGQQLVACMREAISASGLNGSAIAAIGDVSSTGAVEVSDGRFEVDVSIDAQHRPSLDPSRYGGIDDMAALFNNGYSTGGKRVRGMWHGNMIWSRPERPATFFVQQGVDHFNSAYGGQYNATAEIVTDRFSL